MDIIIGTNTLEMLEDADSQNVKAKYCLPVWRDIVRRLATCLWSCVRALPGHIRCALLANQPK